jgi:formylglycine-generating enzyme required for sulfatase activity
MSVAGATGIVCVADMTHKHKRARPVLALLLALALWLVASWPAQADTAPRAGTIFRDCDSCPQMVVIPPGSFVMGTSTEEAQRLGIAPTSRVLPWQQPQHPVTIARAFALGTTPVTRAEYRRFAAEVGPQVAGTNWESPGIRQGDDDPVVRVSWKRAMAYVEWLRRHTGLPYRLPTEAEWEYAARAGTRSAYWWGDDPGTARTVCDDCGSDWDGKGTAPVRHFAANPFGLYDMLGQVFEWNADCWNASYVGAPADGSAWMQGDCSMHSARGGSWNLDARYSRAGQRSRDAADYEGNMVGFRVARDLP